MSKAHQEQFSATHEPRWTVDFIKRLPRRITPSSCIQVSTIEEITNNLKKKKKSTHQKIPGTSE